MTNSYIAIVEKVVPKGRHGPYAVARCDQIGATVTFSLDISVWEEDDAPEEGTYVMLSDVRKKRAGWRAMKGRFVRPSDKQPSNEF